jgi:hypothetical protein
MRINKKAQLGEQLMIFVFLFFLVIIGGGIIIGTYVFVGPEFDYRTTEAAILNYQIRECFLQGKLAGLDALPGDILTRKDFVFKACRINPDVANSNNLVKICIAGSEIKQCLGEENPVFTTGGDFQPCGMNDPTKFLGCSVESVMKNGKNYVVVTTSKQKIRRASK